jgi:CelD/BcsL family acetyltransferase involved in cellulose biosynthesis
VEFNVVEADTIMAEARVEAGAVQTVETQAAVARLLGWPDAEEISAEWEELSRAALDPNPFFEPAFALSLAQHGPIERRPRFLAVREAAGARRLIGLFVLDCSGPASWKSPFVALGSPLLRQGCAQPALDAALAWLRSNGKDGAGFFHTRMDARGPTCRAILAHAVRNKLPVQEFDRRHRAAMVRDDNAVMREVAGKRRKELARLLRRLEEKGEVTFTTARSIPDVRNAVETFLALEGRGWKGERGTALVCNPCLATFTRAALRRMAGLSRCRIETMSVDGKPIAIGLVLLSRDHAAFWKIAFDEAYAPYSPGAQLTIALARSLAQDSSINLADSCAIPDHPMIDHLWVDRREIVDIFIGCGDLGQFQRAVQMEQTKRSLRRIAKSAFLTLTGRRPV